MNVFVTGGSGLIGSTIAGLGWSGVNWVGSGTKIDGVLGKVVCIGLTISDPAVRRKLRQADPAAPTAVLAPTADAWAPASIGSWWTGWGGWPSTPRA